MQSYEGKYTERPHLAETLEQTPRCGGEVVQKAPGVIVSAIMTLLSRVSRLYPWNWM